MRDRKYLIIEGADSTEDPQWVVSYMLSNTEYDDDLEEDNIQEVMFQAPEVGVAVRYAEQYLKKMQTEEETSAEWAEATILSVALY